MAIMNEDFLRCKHCNKADFVKNEVLTLPKGLTKRYGPEEAIELPILDKRVIYTCVTCNTQLDL